MPRKTLSRTLSLAGITCFAVGCDQSALAPTQTANSEATPGTVLTGATPTTGTAEATWTVSSAQDAMTDQVESSARARLRGERVSVDVLIACTPSQTKYVLTTLDDDGRPIPMLTNYGQLHAQVRLDQDPPIRSGFPISVSNQFEFFDTNARLPSARRVTVRLPMAGWDETIVIDQSDPTLRSMLDPCAQVAVQREERSRRAAQADYERQRAGPRCIDHPSCFDLPPRVMGMGVRDPEAPAPTPPTTDEVLEDVDRT